MRPVPQRRRRASSRTCPRRPASRSSRRKGRTPNARERPVGKSLGVVVCDPDGDGWPDLVVANDTVRNFFFHNVPGPDGTRKFEEKGLLVGAAYADEGEPAAAWASTGASTCPGQFGAVDRQLRQRAAHASSTVADPNGSRFSDSRAGRRPGRAEPLALKFGTFFFDYDLDGRLDLLVCNGHIEPEIATVQAGQTVRPAGATVLEHRRPAAALRAGDARGGRARTCSSRWSAAGCAYADFDGDGDLDVVLVENNGRGPAAAQRHRSSATSTSGSTSRATARRRTLSAIGAEVTVEAGGQDLPPQVTGARGYLSQSELPLTVGLGTATTVDKVTVRWPGKDAAHRRCGRTSRPTLPTHFVRARRKPSRRRSSARPHFSSTARIMSNPVAHSPHGHHPMYLLIVLPSQPVRFSPLARPRRCSSLVAGVGGRHRGCSCARPTAAKPDPVAAAHANARGIGAHGAVHTYPDGRQGVRGGRRSSPRTGRPRRSTSASRCSTRRLPTNLDRALEAVRGDPRPATATTPTPTTAPGSSSYYRSELAEAATHFEAVNRIDPNDAHAWYCRGTCHSDRRDSDEAYELLREGAEAQPVPERRPLRPRPAPHHARRREAQDATPRRVRDAAHGQRAWTSADIKYTEMGRYAEVIGKSPAPAPAVGPSADVRAGEGARRQARRTARRGPRDDKLDDLRKAVRARFGGTIVLLDYNRDGKPDVFLLGAVMRGGKVRDLLLRNDGNNAFTDVTAEAGLAGTPAASAARSATSTTTARRPRARRAGRGEAVPQRGRQGVRGQDRGGGLRQGTGVFLDRGVGRPRPGRRPRSRRCEVRPDAGPRAEATHGREGRRRRAAGRVRERRRGAAGAGRAQPTCRR